MNHAYKRLGIHHSLKRLPWGPGGFFDLLPCLVFYTSGGSPITEAIGRWLRGLGADGLIFPSARTDVSCTYDGTELTRWSGWNFVDYRDAPAPDWTPRLIEQPDSWRFASPAPTSDEAKKKTGPLASGYDIKYDDDGNWHIVGQSKRTKDSFYTLHQAKRAGGEMRRDLTAQLDLLRQNST